MEETSNVLFSIGPIEITGVVVTMWVIIAVLTVLSILATRNMKDVPGPLQNLAEQAVGKLHGYYSNILGEKLTDKCFPVLATVFVFIIVSNYSGLLPGAGVLIAVMQQQKQCRQDQHCSHCYNGNAQLSRHSSSS